MEEELPYMLRDVADYREKVASTNFYVVKTALAEKPLIMLGVTHTKKPEAIAQWRQILDAQYARLHVGENDLLLIEGSLPKEQLTPEDALRTGGEQAYFAALARGAGITVKSWDIPTDTWATIALERHAPELVWTYFSCQLAKLFFSNGETVSQLAMADIFKAYFPSFDLSNVDFLHKILIATGQSDIRDVTLDMLEKVVSPYEKTPMGEMIAEIQVRRDTHALEMLSTEAKKSAKRIIVTAGKDHVLTWEHSLRK